MSIEEFANLAKGVQAMATAFALLTGGIWTYRIFIKQRQIFPRASISHTVFTRDISAEHTLFRLGVEISNSGDVLIKLEKCFVWLQQVDPWPKGLYEYLEHGQPLLKSNTSEIVWPIIEEIKLQWDHPLEIEPGELDTVYFDFIVKKDLACACAYSHFSNFSKTGKEIGWNCTTMHLLDCEKGSALKV